MIYWVVYDIASNRIRSKLADSLEAVGLTRIQQSVFAGTARRKVFWKMIRDYEQKIDELDKLFVLKLSARQMEEMHSKGFEGDMDLILGQKHTWIV